MLSMMCQRIKAVDTPIRYFLMSYLVSSVPECAPSFLSSHVGHSTFQTLPIILSTCVQNEKMSTIFECRCAGLSLVVQDPERRRTLALYVADRVAQCWYNSLKNKGEWSLLSSSVGPSCGDSILFALATSQVMCGFPYSCPPLAHWNLLFPPAHPSPTALPVIPIANI